MNLTKKQKTWLVILCCALVFFMFKSCTVSRKYDIAQERITILQRKNDSLTNKIGVMTAEEKGLKNSISIQSSAMDKINETRKNIRVTLRK